MLGSRRLQARSSLPGVSERGTSERGARGASGHRQRFTRRASLGRSAALTAALAPATALAAACSSAGSAPAQPAGSAPAAGAKQVTLTFASNASAAAEEPVLNAVIAEYMNRFPNVKIEATYAPADQLREKLIVQLAGGTPPDLFRQNDDEVKGIAAGKHLLELDPYMKTFRVNTDDYFPLAYDDIPRWEGKVYAVTTGGRPEAIFYNKSILQEVGVPFPPKNVANAWSWSEFRAHLPKLVKRDAAGKPSSWAFAWEYWTFDRIGQMNGTEGLVKCDLSEFIMNRPKNVEVLQDLQNLSRDGFAAPYSMWSNPGTTTMFMNGQLAMAVLHSSAHPNLLRATEERGLDWDIAPWPKFKNKALSCTYLDAFSLSKATSQPEAAAQFAFFLISDYAAERWMFGPDPQSGTRGPTVPMLKRAFKDPRWLDSKLPPGNVQLWEQQIINDARFPESACYRDLTEPMRPNFERVWNVEGDVQREMDDLKPKIDVILKTCPKEKAPRRITC